MCSKAKVRPDRGHRCQKSLCGEFVAIVCATRVHGLTEFRYLGTWCLWIRAPSAYVPSTWDEKHLRHQRTLYSSLSDAFHLEKTLMCVCPKWGLACAFSVTLITPVLTFFSGETYSMAASHQCCRPNRLTRSSCYHLAF